MSRRTAYRYFPTQEQLLTEVALESLRPQIEGALAAAAKGDVEQSLDKLVNVVQQAALDNERLLRAMVRLTVDREPGARDQSEPKRGSRRVDWIEMALQPARQA